MKKYGFFAALIIVCGITMLVACQPQSQSSGSAASQSASEQSVADANSGATTQPASLEQTVDKYLVDTFGKQYAQADVCIPQQIVIATDEADDQDIKVWGDFWVFNYSIAGDTLKTASGGSHPGLIHLKKGEKGYEVTGFDQVGDGSQFEPTAKKIFGDKYDAFMIMHSNEKDREQNRAQGIAKYAKSHDLKVTMYQDYGWPAEKLPE